MRVFHLAVNQERLYGIEIAIAPRPEMQPLHFVLYADRTSLARLQRDTLASNDVRQVAVGIMQLGKQPHGAGLAALVAHLRLHMHHGLAVRDVKIRGIDVGARGSQIAIKRQRLVEFARDVQIHILGNAAIVGVEVAVVPLIAALKLPRTVGP